MTFIPQLVTLAAVLLLACMSPGPDFVAVTSNALSSRRAGLGVALGISLACVVWASLAMFGLGVILARVAWLYEAVRIVGAIYLVRMGVLMLLATRRPATVVAVEAGATDHRSALVRGLLVGMTNPKSAAFFGSLFVTVLPLGAPAWVQAATLLVVAAVACVWFSTLALVFSIGRVRSIYAGIRRPIDAVMGTILVALGLRLAVGR